MGDEGIVLKPCPFCGCREVMISYSPRARSRIMIRCPNCNASFERVIKGKAGYSDALVEAYHEIVGRWNKRQLDTEEENK